MMSRLEIKYLWWAGPLKLPHKASRDETNGSLCSDVGLVRLNLQSFVSMNTNMLN